MVCFRLVGGDSRNNMYRKYRDQAIGWLIARKGGRWCIYVVSCDGFEGFLVDVMCEWEMNEEVEKVEHRACESQIDYNLCQLYRWRCLLFVIESPQNGSKLKHCSLWCIGYNLIVVFLMYIYCLKYNRLAFI